MKKILLLLTALTSLTIMFLTTTVYSQLGNFNMYLIKNIDTRRVPAPHTPPWHYSALWGYSANGREYAILGCVTGTQIVDITDSADVREVYYRPANINFNNPDQGNLWRELKVYSHYLYVVSEADTSAIEIYDLAGLPDTAVYLGRYIIPGHRTTHTISQSGPYLYLNGANTSFGQGTTILDLSNPTAPVKRGSWNVEYVHDSRTIDDTMYTSNINTGKLAVFDVTNKDSVRLINSFLTIPNPFTHNSAITRDKKYIFTTDETTNPPGRLKIWNIEDLANVTFTASWQPTGITNTIVHNVEIYGDTAVIAHYQAGVRVLNISNPQVPLEVAWYDTYPSNNTNQFAGCWGVYKFPSGKIIASDMNTGLYVLKMGVPFGIQNISSEVPSAFRLEQNYPNPFNPNTKIRFSIAKEQQTELRVYDITGKEAATLVNQQLKAGVYEFDWNASNLPSGVYFYKLTAGGFVSAKKMILVK